MAEDYTRGEMDISQHKATFEGVMGVSVFASLITGLTVLYLTLVFGAELGWLNALIASAIVGGIAGVVMKQGAGYWVTLGVLAVITVISGGLVSALGQG
ncbi:MAG: aa3-type cytochrome c oxidase subunit IV [Alphaproteobacteria bacterium]|nr:aa3-type cytochrome c oxidase subunit IV [Alphaproteobacteria bacterium]